MSELNVVPQAFIKQRLEVVRNYGPCSSDSGIGAQHCASCGHHNHGELRRYPEAKHRNLSQLMAAARVAASTSRAERIACLRCGSTEPQRQRCFVYAHTAGRLAKDLLLVMRVGVSLRCVRAVLLSADGVLEEIGLDQQLKGLTKQIFATAVVLYREAYVALSLNNEPERALRNLEQAVKRDPLFTPAHILRAEILLGYGRTLEATPHVQEALRVSPDDSEANLLQGRLLIAAGHPNDARKHLETASHSVRAASAAFYRLGLISEDAGDSGQARSAYEAALSSDSHNEGARRRLDALERGVQWRFFRSDQPETVVKEKIQKTLTLSHRQP